RARAANRSRLAGGPVTPAVEVAYASAGRKHPHFTILTDVTCTRDTGASPFRGAFSIASTAARPSTTVPNTVYFPSSDGASPVTMKNDVVALAGSSPRAIDTMPFT